MSQHTIRLLFLSLLAIALTVASAQTAERGGRAEGRKSAAPLPELTPAANPEKIVVVSALEKETKQPLEDVVVQIRFYGEGYQQRNNTVTLQADEDGGFSVGIPESPKPKYIRVLARAPGYAPVQTPSWNNTPDAKDSERVPDSFVFLLEKAIEAGGKVVNEQREPVEGARVSFYVSGSVGAKREGGMFDLRDLKAVTDAEGVWKCDWLPADPAGLRMNVNHRDYLGRNDWSNISNNIFENLRSFSETTTLRKGLYAAGVVRDETGAPVAGAMVRMGEGFWGMSNQAKTDDQGRFTIKNLKEGPMHVCVQAPGKAPFAQRLTADEVANPLEFSLEPGKSIRFRVVDSSGKPIQGVNVAAGIYKGYRDTIYMGKDGRQRWTTTDADGMAEWDSAPQDAVQYTFTKEGYARLEEVELTAGDELHTVVLPKSIRISGSVTDKETGRPIETFNVVPVLDWLTGSTPYLERRRTFEAKEGRYEWKTGRTDTGHYIRIEADGFRPAMSEMFRVGKAEEKTINFELVKAPNIEGIVVGPDGEPVEGVEIFVSSGLHRSSFYNSRVGMTDDEKMA